MLNRGSGVCPVTCNSSRALANDACEKEAPRSIVDEEEEEEDEEEEEYEDDEPTVAVLRFLLAKSTSFAKLFLLAAKALADVPDEACVCVL